MPNKLFPLLAACALSLTSLQAASAASLGDRDLAIATLLYAQVAGETCNDVSLSKPVRASFMTDNGLKEADFERTSAQWGEIEEALTELGALFREENAGACNTAWLLLGQTGHMASGMLVRAETVAKSTRRASLGAGIR